MAIFYKGAVPALRAANPRMKNWSDAKVLRVCNRRARKEEKKLEKLLRKKNKK